MIEHRLKKITFRWVNGKEMEIEQMGVTFAITKVYLLSLIRFGLRVLTRKEVKA